MKRKKDPRVNAGVSVKEYLLVLVILAILNGSNMILNKYFIDRGMLETNLSFVINVFRVNLLITAGIFVAIMAVFRQIAWSRPLRIFSEATQKIARGDFSVRIPPLRKDGKKDFVEVLFDDFNAMVKELSSIETMKNDFIANVSHEIKTPLAVIQSYATALQKDTLRAEERKEYVQTIVEAAQKLTALVTNILKLNKLENQGIVPEARAFDLSEHIRRCAVAVEELWEQKGIGFEADLDEINVCYDESLLEIVWNNLLSNAVKFTNPGGKIMVSLKARDGFAVVSVSDTGIGIEKETQKRIFDKFFQGDASHAVEGNGLGLALVKKTLELLDGTITVDSAPGHGSTFTVCLKI